MSNSISFSLDKKNTRFHGAHSPRSLEIKGHFSMQGPQSDEQIPSSIVELFDNNPHIDEVAVNTINASSVYSRIGGELSKKQAEPKEQIAAVKFLKMVELVGFTVVKSYHIENQYNRDCNDDPWLLVITDMGHFIIGWRKRVVSIEWADMPSVRGIVTEDNVTKDETMVHAYGMGKTLDYLTELHHLYKKARTAALIKENK